MAITTGTRATLQRATASSTLSSLLKSVSSTANMVTGVVEGVSETGMMFQDFMRAAREKQQINIEIEMATYATNALEQGVLAMAESRKEIRDFISASESNKEIYAKAEDDLMKAIAARRGTKDA